MNFLKRLFGRKETPVELPPEFLQEEPPDWLIDLKGAALPHGNRFSIRVQILHATRAGTVEIVMLPRNDGEEPKSTNGALAQTELDRLLVILGFSFPGDIIDVPAQVIDGMPVNISIHRHEPYSMAAGECNLAGWMDARKPGPPVIEIGKILLEAQQRILPMS
jgi:hypothetical protein